MCVLVVTLNFTFFDEFSNLFRFMQIFATRFLNFWKRNDLLFSLFAREDKKQMDQCVTVLHNFTDKVIRDRRKLLLTENRDESVTDETSIGRKRRMALLDVLLKSTIDGQPLTNQEIQEEVDTFLFAVGEIRLKITRKIN